MLRQSFSASCCLAGLCIASFVGCESAGNGSLEPTATIRQAVTVNKGVEVAVDAPVMLPTNDGSYQVAFGDGFFSVQWTGRWSDTANVSGLFYQRIARVPLSGAQVFPHHR